MTPDGPGTGGAVPVLNFYAAQGVIFKAVALDFSKGLAIPNFAHSGTRAIETCYAVEFCSAPIEMTFTQAQTRVRLWVGFSSSLAQSATVAMHAFADDGSQVGQTIKTLPANATPTAIETAMEITTIGARIARVTVGLESGGAPTFTMAVDDVEFDTAGPPPACAATQDPTVSISQPENGQTVQFDQFILAFVVNSADPFATTTITDAGSGQVHSVSYPGFNGSFGPSWVNGLLVPGSSTLTVAVKDCHGTAQASTTITLTPIASDERFHILGFDTTQAISNVPGSVPLIADKPTMVRVYLNSTGSTARITGVRGRMSAYRPVNSFSDRGLPLLGNLHSSNSIDVDASSDLEAKRFRFDRSLNFQLPAEWISEGAVHFEVAFDIDGSPTSPAAIPCDGCNNIFFNGAPVFVHFLATPVLRLRIVGLEYQVGTPPVHKAPRAVDFALLQSWIQRAYPTGQFDVTTVTATSSHARPFDCDAANAQLSSIRATEVASGIDTHTHYIALVSNARGFMRGCASGIPDTPDTTVVASSPTGNPKIGPYRPVNVDGDTDASFGDWYGGHELAHEFGRAHPGFCNDNSRDDTHFPNAFGQINPYVGLDMGDAANSIPPAVISPARFDIMTYCDQPQWLSAYTYEAVLRRLNDENNVPNTPVASSTSGGDASVVEPRAGEAMVGDFVSIVASVNLTRKTAAIRYIDHVARATVPPQPQNELASVQLRDTTGKIIGSYKTWVREDTDIPAGHDRTGSVHLIIPADRSAAVLELLLQGKVVDRRRVSKHAPIVKALKLIDRPSPFDVSPVRLLTWIGFDLDGDRLTYLVQIGSNREMWETIAVGLPATRLELTDEQLRGDQRRRVRVIANDGFNVSTPAMIDLAPAQ
ncbi:MAG TPA: hypothetical protein VHT21_17200 [Stellaceae bacterium]|nr:hypothetical protein [Stellaceae bacterium]